MNGKNQDHSWLRADENTRNMTFKMFEINWWPAGGPGARGELLMHDYGCCRIIGGGLKVGKAGATRIRGKRHNHG